jgi:hypothetical protein
MIRLKSILTEDKVPTDKELYDFVMTPGVKLPAGLQKQKDKYKSSPVYKDKESDIDYAQVVNNMGHAALVKAYNEK